jgi:hypothetical protein
MHNSNRSNRSSSSDSTNSSDSNDDSSDSSDSSTDSSTDSDSDDSSTSTDSSISSMDDHNDVSDDDSSISSIESNARSEDTMDRFMASFFIRADPPLDVDYLKDLEEYSTVGSTVDVDYGGSRRRFDRLPNKYAYEFGDYLNCNYYRQFLCPERRPRMYEDSKSRHSNFRSHFRVPLSTIDDLRDLFLSRGWVRPTKRCNTQLHLKLRTELFIMCALEHLGNRRPHTQFKTETEMSMSAHLLFYKHFLNCLYRARSEWIYFPRSMDELYSVTDDYHRQELPGAAGSIDVVHVKWSHCPAGEFNKCKGKESFASLAFQCITNHVYSSSPIWIPERQTHCSDRSRCE